MSGVHTIYIYELPLNVRANLCNILDRDCKWEELAQNMQYDLPTIQRLRFEAMKGNSASEELLTLWGHQNHRVFELFILLRMMEHFEAMAALKSFVDPTHHHYMDHGDGARTTGVLKVSDISSVANLPQISYEELQRSTNNWSQTQILGKGGFGVVFKGMWKYTDVAIKRLEGHENKPEYYKEQIKQSVTELNCLNMIRHDNVLPLYGYSIGGPHPCLIYQFMSGGCLHFRLHIPDARRVLPWWKRQRVAIGTARGLQFLHTIFETPLIHGDIKPPNILLDINDIPKIGDFGLAREGPRANKTHLTVSRIFGTRPYLPEEYLHTRKLSTKVDTFSFGIVLFEIATVLPVFDPSRKDKLLNEYVFNFEGDLAELKDKRAEGGEECFNGLMQIAKLCVNKRSRDRPEMVDVLVQLEAVKL